MRKLKFEFPEGMYNELKHTGLDGETWVLNHKKFQELWGNEMNDRAKFLDLSLAIEQCIERTIVEKLTEDSINQHFIDEIILTKVSFNDKILILKSILSDDYFHDRKLLFNKIDEKTILIDNYDVVVNKMIEVINQIRDIRNHSAHGHHHVFTVRDTIVLRSKTKMFESKEINKQEALIKGQFVLWLLWLITDKNSFINKKTLKTYFRKYKKVLKEVAVINNVR